MLRNTKTTVVEVLPSAQNGKMIFRPFEIGLYPMGTLMPSALTVLMLMAIMSLQIAAGPQRRSREQINVPAKADYDMDKPSLYNSGGGLSVHGTQTAGE